MKIRAYQSTDFGVIQRFWTHKGLPPIVEDHLPAVGRVVETESGALLSAAFLVQSDTSLASFAFVCGNPEILSDARSEALDMVLKNLATVAKQIGYTQIGAATNVPALQRRYLKLGLEPTDMGVVCYGGML